MQYGQVRSEKEKLVYDTDQLKQKFGNLKPEIKSIMIKYQSQCIKHKNESISIRRNLPY